MHSCCIDIINFAICWDSFVCFLFFVANFAIVTLTRYLLIYDPLQAFEHLCTLELVRQIEGSTAKCQKEYRQMNLLVEASQIVDALQKYPGCPTDVRQWGQSSLSA